MANSQSKIEYNFDVQTDEPYINKLTNIKSKHITYEDNSYCILNYDQNYVCDDDYIRGTYNSVVLDTNRDILAIGPGKTLSLELFKQTNGSTLDMSMFSVNELIEGLFFQMFYNKSDNKWEISTKNAIGGKYSYYRMPDITSLSYRDMIYQAINVNDINEWDAIEHMNEKYCYHFILQHPNNHVVLTIKEPKIYFFGAFELHYTKTNNIRYVSLKECEKIFPSTVVEYSKPYEINNEMEVDDIIEKYASIQEDSNRMGIVITKNSTGERAIVICPNYKHLQELRGTHPNIMYQYICLYRVKRVSEFLKHFPQYNNEFRKFKTMYDTFVTNLHKTYYKYFIQKNKSPVNKKYFYHIMQIHNNIFIPSLQEETKTIIKRSIVQKYIDELEPGNILHILQNERYEQDNK